MYNSVIPKTKILRYPTVIAEVPVNYLSLPMHIPTLTGILRSCETFRSGNSKLLEKICTCAWVSQVIPSEKKNKKVVQRENKIYQSSSLELYRSRISSSTRSISAAVVSLLAFGRGDIPSRPEAKFTLLVGLIVELLVLGLRAGLVAVARAVEG